MTRRSRKCPLCGETGIPILHGLPARHVFQASERGLLVLGGCLVDDNDPTWWYEEDQYAWDGPDPSKAISEALRSREDQP